MDLSFKDVVEILAEFFRIKPAKKSAFANRIKNFQRAGLLPQINTGRGVAARYKPMDVYLLLMALQMSELGLQPDRIIKIFEDDAFMLSYALSRAMGGYGGDNDILLTIRGAGLSDLQKSPHTRLNFEVGVVSADDGRQLGFSGPRPVSLVNVSQSLIYLIALAGSGEFEAEIRAAAERASLYGDVAAANDEPVIGERDVRSKA